MATTSLAFLGQFPQGLARYIIPRFQPVSALDNSQVTDLEIDDLVQPRLADYEDYTALFPVLQSARLWVEQVRIWPFPLVDLFYPSPLSSLCAWFNRRRYKHILQTIADLALEFSQKNPSIHTIQHFDPVHDGWLTR